MLELSPDAVRLLRSLAASGEAPSVMAKALIERRHVAPPDRVALYHLFREAFAFDEGESRPLSPGVGAGDSESARRMSRKRQRRTPRPGADAFGS